MASSARFYCPDVSAPGETLHLQGEEHHHLRNVLRLKAGDRISLFDGRGRGFQASLVSTDARESVLLVGLQEPDGQESPLAIHLAPALAKGEKLDLVIQKGTELGVFAFHPLASTRADLKLEPSRAEARRERWKRVALEACKQSGRTRIPEIFPPVGLEEFLRRDLPLERAVLDPSGEPLGPPLPRTQAADCLIAIGPEGGWDAQELMRMRDHRFHVVRLGPRILRAETAAIAAACLWQLRNGDLSR